MITNDDIKNSENVIFTLDILWISLFVWRYEWHVMACSDQMMMYSNTAR